MSGLWPHQQKGFELARAEFKQGHKWVCLVMSTGAGKTRTGVAFVLAHLQRKPEGRVLWVAHREELVGQAFDDLKAGGLSVGAIQASPTREVNPHRPVQVASIQTLTARDIFIDDVSLLVYDECHHCMSGTWSEYVLRYKKAGCFGIGFTATPIRADGLPLGDIYDSLVCPVTMAELIEQGFLVPYELVRPKGALRKGQLAQHPVDAYLEHAKGRKAIVFAANIVSGNIFVEQFRAAGITAEIVTGATDAGTRRQILEHYKAGSIQVLCNVGVLTEGFDDRPTSCVIIARSVGSVTLYLQMCGRALRTSSETGKSNAILIDLYGSSWKHEEPGAHRDWTLDGEGIRRKVLPTGPERFCPLCGVTMGPNDSICLECGSTMPGQKPPEVINAPLIKYAWKRSQPPARRADDLRKWLAFAESAGHKAGAAMHKYKAVYGDWPSADVLRAARMI